VSSFRPGNVVSHFPKEHQFRDADVTWQHAIEGDPADFRISAHHPQRPDDSRLLSDLRQHSPSWAAAFAIIPAGKRAERSDPALLYPLTEWFHERNEHSRTSFLRGIWKGILDSRCHQDLKWLLRRSDQSEELNDCVISEVSVSVSPSHRQTRMKQPLSSGKNGAEIGFWSAFNSIVSPLRHRFEPSREPH
jgi:hypothetical protein